MQPIEKFTKAFSDKNRLKIIDILFKEPLKVSQVAIKMDIEENLASHHLRTLSKSGILKSNKRGREVFYSINRNKILSLTKQIIKKQYMKDIVKEALKAAK